MRILAAIAFLLLVVPVAWAANDWPQYRYNETHQGLVPAGQNTEFGPFKENWWIDVTIPGPPGSPSVRENIVYYGDVNGRLWALDGESGGLIWNNATSANPIIGAPAVGQDFVYVVNKGGNLYSFNRKTGQAQAGYPVPVGKTDGSIMFHENEDLLYIGNDEGKVRAYSAQGKYEKWSFQATNATLGCSGGQIKGSPVIYKSLVMFGSTNKCFFGVSKTSFGVVPEKDTVWAFKAIDSIRSTPTIDITNEKVIFGDQSGNLYAIPYASTGVVTASPTYTEPSVSGLSSEIVVGPAIADGKIIFGSRNGFVRALPLSGGSAIWSQDLHGQIASSPAVANGHVLVGSFDRKMYTLNLANGTIEDQRLALGEIETSPAIAGTQGFWASKDGSLYSFGGTKPQRADLAVEGFTASGATEGKSTSVRATIKNVGVLPSEATVAKLYLGSATVSETDVPALEPNGEFSYSGSFTPASRGTVQVRLFVDPTRAIRESDESNNDVTISVNVAKAAPTPTGNTATSSEEGGIPGFEPFALVSAIGVALLAFRRRGAKR